MRRCDGGVRLWRWRRGGRLWGLQRRGRRGGGVEGSKLKFGMPHMAHVSRLGKNIDPLLLLGWMVFRIDEEPSETSDGRNKIFLFKGP